MRNARESMAHAGARALEIANTECPTEVVEQTSTVRQLSNLTGAMACSAGAVWASQSSQWVLMAVCWLIGGHFMHTFALSFHDAAHGTLHPNRRVNEWLGHFYGTLILIPLTVYRRAHAHHHAQLAKEQDPELYPYVIPGTSRAFRLTCAVAEILLGYLYTPLLFLRSVLVDEDLPESPRQQILLEYEVIAWVAIPSLFLIWLTSAWRLYLVGVIAPAMMGGAYQTLRKFTEHMGLLGDNILESTRSILPRDRWNEAISSLVQHVDHHGTHHVRARIPFFELPVVSERIYRGKLAELPVYHSYAMAFWAMLRTLPDPKVGAQWRTEIKQ